MTTFQLDARMQWPEWAVRAWEPVAPYAQKLAVWRGYEAELQTLLIYAIGISVYIGFVFAFYQSISKRDAFSGKRERGFGGWLAYMAKSWLVFPLMSFLYFSVLAGSLFLLAKSQDTKQIFLVAMSVVVGVRVVTYASEGAATDLAKLLPLGLLGVLIVDPTTIQWSQVWARFAGVSSQLPLLGRYFLLFLVMETTLKAIRGTLLRIGDRAALRRSARPIKRKQLVAKVEEDAAVAHRSVPVKAPAPAAAPAGAPAHGPREGPAAPSHPLFSEVE